MPTDARTLVLDTHVWIWMIEGVRERLASRVLKRTENAARVGGVRVSAISVWEVAMLERKGRLSFSIAIEDWVESALTAPGIQLQRLEPGIAMGSALLPGSPPGDPADRILMATARSLDAMLVTCDRSIIEYGRGGHVRVLDARPA